MLEVGGIHHNASAIVALLKEEWRNDLNEDEEINAINQILSSAGMLQLQSRRW